MRIISGKYKGRIINPPSGLKLRPTTDMAREGLFNILNNIIHYEDITVLDLFAGTGSISYEFISRGAKLVHAVEIKHKHSEFVRNNSTKLGMQGLQVFTTDIRKYIEKTTHKYDLIFADPPYDLEWLNEIPDMITEAGLLKENGLFILEHPGNYNFSSHKYFSQHRKYGSVNFTFFNNSTTQQLNNSTFF